MKKGFTLIELLAVIVILAIIAVIAVPIVLNIINDSKINANKRSIDMYAKAVENAVASYKLNGNSLSGEFSTIDGKTVVSKTDSNIKLNIDYSGSKVVCETFKIYENGKFYLNDCKVDGVLVIDYYKGEKKLMYTREYIMNQTSDNIIKYDPVANKICSTGETCYNWYVLEDGDTTTLTIGRLAQENQVTLMMDKNIVSGSSWCNLTDGSVFDGCDVYQPEAAMSTLNSLTNTWSTTATLPTYEQIYSVTNSSDLTNILWLYENITDDYMIPPSDAAVYGYWTSTLAPNNRPYFIQLGAKVSIGNGLYPADRTGIRPVITISKDLLK